LEAFTGEGGAPRGRAAEEPAGELVTGGPEVVPGALESEHRVVDVEREERLAVGGVGRAYRLARRGRPRLVDTGVQQPGGFGSLVGKEQVAVDREVVLARGVEDLRRGEERVEPEGARLVGDDRHDPLTEVLIAQ